MYYFWKEQTDFKHNYKHKATLFCAPREIEKQSQKQWNKHDFHMKTFF